MAADAAEQIAPGPRGWPSLDLRPRVPLRDRACPAAGVRRRGSRRAAPAGRAGGSRHGERPKLLELALDVDVSPGRHGTNRVTRRVLLGELEAHVLGAAGQAERRRHRHDREAGDGRRRRRHRRAARARPRRPDPRRRSFLRTDVERQPRDALQRLEDTDAVEGGRLEVRSALRVERLVRASRRHGCCGCPACCTGRRAGPGRRRGPSSRGSSRGSRSDSTLASRAATWLSATNTMPSTPFSTSLRVAL